MGVIRLNPTKRLQPARVIRVCALACIAAFVLFHLSSPAAASRVALVVGNSIYAHAPTLKNPAADAKLLAGALRRAGFDSVDLRADLGKAELEAALRDFSRKAQAAEVALIYYAGHGIEAGGENYLIPTDARIERDVDLEVEGTKLETALRMSEGARLRIIILDACRNNPFLATMLRSIRTRAISRGLAAIEPEGETLVVYAAKAGATAADGDSTNSPFASALARRLVQPGLEIGLLFRAVRDDVLRETQRAQEPFTYGSLSGTAFYFLPAKLPLVQTAGTITASKPILPLPLNADDALYWQGALMANTAVAYRDYLKRFPQGQYATLATENLKRFTTQTSRPPIGSFGPVAGNFPWQFDNGEFPNLFRAFRYDGQPAELPGDFAPTIRLFDFRPDLARRANLIAGLHKDAVSNPGFAAHLRDVMPVADPFRDVRPMFERHGLAMDNAVDVSLVFLELYRKLCDATWIEPSTVQMQAARRQLTAAARADPSWADMKPADIQYHVDSMLVSAALFLGQYTEVRRRGPAATAKHMKEMQDGAFAMFGVAVHQLQMTDKGYVKIK
jgi:hypothetical protein